MRAARTIVIIAVLTAIVSSIGLGISSRYERADGPILGFAVEIKPPPNKVLTGRDCDVVLYIKDVEKALGWPYAVKKIVNDTYCGAYPDLYFPDSERANRAIIIFGSGLLSVIIYLAGSRIIRIKRRSK